MEELLISNNETIAVAGDNSRERAEKYFSVECMSESYMKMYMDLARYFKKGKTKEYKGLPCLWYVGRERGYAG
ncbi:MAG: hypothetical protein U9Q12_02920 [Patescibacteria group bacterium]|nr:hypothetical protein [Patescibacteria group bacterium]